MKVFHRILALLLFVVLSTETFGVYRYVHFCGGDPTSESYFIQKKDCCCEDDAEEADMDDCCKDEVKVVQIDSKTTAPVSDNVSTPKVVSFAIFRLPYTEFALNDFFITTFSKVNHDYQFYDSSPPIRHLVCSYLI